MEEIGFYDPNRWADLRRLASTNKEREILEERGRARQEAMGDFGIGCDYDTTPGLPNLGADYFPRQNYKIEFIDAPIDTEALAAALSAVGVAFIELRDAMAAVLYYAFNAFQRALDAFEELVDAVLELEADDAENRHDGARRPPVPQLIPARSLHELYGQGVDHGGPGLPRLTLIRVTDDGLRRAETGKLRKGGNGNEEIQRLRPGGA